MMTDVDWDRAAIAAVLRGLGHVPWPLRNSQYLPEQAKWGVRKRLCALDPRGERSTIDELADGMLSDFERPCLLELLTGAASNTVAVNAWTTEGEAWIYMNLPETPMILEGTSSGTVLFYRHPGKPVESRHVFVDGPAEPAIIRVFGEWGSIPVPPSAYEAILAWPAVSALPEFNPTWMPRR
jgi:hypothetical protein